MLFILIENLFMYVVLRCTLNKVVESPDDVLLTSTSSNGTRLSRNDLMVTRDGGKKKCTYKPR